MALVVKDNYKDKLVPDDTIIYSSRLFYSIWTTQLLFSKKKKTQLLTIQTQSTNMSSFLFLSPIDLLS